MTDREIRDTDVDEAWLREWARTGIERLEAYLARRAAVADLLARRPDLHSDDGGSTRSV